MIAIAFELGYFSSRVMALISDTMFNLYSGEKDADPEVALEFLAKHCQWAVVTLGANGCIAKHGKEVRDSPFTFCVTCDDLEKH